MGSFKPQGLKPTKGGNKHKANPPELTGLEHHKVFKPKGLIRIAILFKTPSSKGKTRNAPSRRWSMIDYDVRSRLWQRRNKYSIRKEEYNVQCRER